jgi:hypothetical protein
MLKHTFVTLFIIVFLVLFTIAFIVIPGQNLIITKARVTNFNNCLAKATTPTDQEFCARVFK